MVIEINTVNGLPCTVPEKESEDSTPKFLIPSESIEAIKFYKKEGFVVLKNFIKKSECNFLMNAWEKEVKIFKGHIYRQSNAKAEKNKFNDKKWIMNPILNLQSINPKKFPTLRMGFEKTIVSNFKLAKIVGQLIGDKPTIVQSMYFEGNSSTWEHQDSYYLDDEKIGNMIAGWVALEDIKADAGRFFVLPKSHLEDYSDMDKSNAIHNNHDLYIKNIVKKVVDKGFKIIAPKLDQGDILLWNSLTIHGSLDSQSEKYRRSSITFHAIRQSSKFNVLRSSLRDINSEKKLPFSLFRPKDLNKKRNLIIMFIETKMPWLFYKLKNISINILVSNKKIK